MNEAIINFRRRVTHWFFRPDILHWYCDSWRTMWRNRLFNRDIYRVVERANIIMLEKHVTDLDEKAAKAMGKPGANQLARDSTVPDEPDLIIFEEASDVWPEMWDEL